MIQRLDIAAVHYSLGDDLRKYVTKKIGKLDKYLGRRVHSAVHAEIKLKGEKQKTRKQYTCEVILHLPHEIITTKETTLNMFAAVDIVEAKLKNQIKTYKDKHLPAKFHRRLIAKLRRQG